MMRTLAVLVSCVSIVRSLVSSFRRSAYCVLFCMCMFRRFGEAILETWFDELMFGIGVTSLWPHFYYFRSTGGSAADQIVVTCVLFGYRGVDVKYSTRKNALPYGDPSAREGS